MMRNDEIYAKESLVKYLSKDYENLEIIQGEDPPDFYVLYSNNKILLEVTRAEPIYSDKEGIKNRNTIEISLIELCDQLDQDVGSQIIPGKTLYVFIKGPIANYSKFKTSLRKKVISIIQHVNLLYSFYNHWIDINIEGNMIQMKLIDSTAEKKRICGLISIADNNAILNIDLQAGLILEERILTKEHKTKIINGSEWYGEKWLAILNGYFLASSETYISAIRRKQISHSFSKIFLIEEQYSVTEIF